MSTQSHPARRLVKTAIPAAAAAVAVNAAIYSLGRAADVTYVISRTASDAQRIHVGDVVSFTLMAFAFGVVVAALAMRIGRPRLATIETLAAVVAVASTAMDLPIDSTAPAKVLLASMHLVAGVAFIAALRRADHINQATLTISSAEHEPATAIAA